MRNWPKTTFSLIIAIIFTMALLILPDASLEFKERLNFLSKGNNTAIAFGHYLVQKITSSALVIIATVILSIAAHRTYTKYKKG